MTLSELNTPCALVDEARLAHNLQRMARQARELGVALRPHVKTAKCVAIARQQQALGARGLTVSTLKEAEQFHAAGFHDILYAVGIAPAKLAQARALRERGCDLTLLVDSLAAAQAVAASGHRFPVLIEIDTDDHRAGVKPDEPRLLDIARVLHEGAELRGVMTHCGASYELSDPEALAAMAEQERARCVAAAERLRAAGLPCPVVSVGSTPTALAARRLDGVTEMRPGVYVFHDLVMLNVGVCSADEIAMSVLATVIGHQHEKGWVLTDAGWMALSRDRGTQGQHHDYGYGAVCDEAGRLLPGLVVSGANQEHGIVSGLNPALGDVQAQFPIGTRLRILPNHACATAAAFDHYEVVRADGTLARWPRFNGW